MTEANYGQYYGYPLQRSVFTGYYPGAYVPVKCIARRYIEELRATYSNTS